MERAILPVLRDVEHLDLDLLPLTEHGGQVLDKTVGHLGDVHHAGLSAGQCNKGAELLDAGDLSFQNGPYL